MSIVLPRFEPACAETPTADNVDISIYASNSTCATTATSTTTTSRHTILYTLVVSRGNWIGEYPYSPGAPCSKCDKGCTCSDSLCDESGHDTSNVIQTVQAPAAAPIAYYRRTELHSSQSKAPLKSLGVVQRGQSHSWQWSSKGDSKVQYSPQVQTQWQTRTVYHKKPVSLRALSGGERQSRGHVIRSDARSSSRCIDRLPSCRAWHRQCKTSRVVQLSCLKTCNRCDSVHQIISYDHSKRSKPTTNNAKERNRAKQLRHRPNHRGTIQRQRAAADGGTSPSRHRRRHRRIGASQPGTKLKPKPDRRRAFNEVAKYRGQRMRYGGRISTSGQNRMFRARKVQTRRRQSPRRRQSSRNKSTCSDDDKYSDRCTYWHRSGYCAENQMMRDVFCRKTCGGC
ncbi:uncharacterized protein LOC121374838 [Gigantopelta aegis]|uniref:uncharacterized protein LOC121374838 n=1 Tax=Gigantopelta aegis TaxID=1735272 RepID=UPI001B88D6D4|nr:uncharacterized protein LOC121374838 [Gigantopelta aegis]